MDDRSQENIFVRFLQWLRGLFRSEPGADSSNPPKSRRPAPTPDGPDSDKVRTQVRIVRDAFGGRLGVAQAEHGNDASVQYMFRAGHVLVDATRADEVVRYFEANPDIYRGPSEQVETGVEGIALLTLPSRAHPTEDPDVQTFTELESHFGPGICTPDHLIYVTHTSGPLCPATEPEPASVTTPWPSESRDRDRGSGVRISVVDTGWWKDAATDPETPWIAQGVDGDLEQYNPAAIPPYGGHGTFVAGVIRCQAPEARIHIHGALHTGGASFETEIIRELDIAISDPNPPNIISISGGTHTFNGRPLKTFEHLAEKHRLGKDPSAPLIVAAAGNDGADDPFWPAAFDWVVGVGSVDADDSVSDYSNFGTWINVYALGRDHVNAFPVGTYHCYEPENVNKPDSTRQFTGLAKWSGTSFSTPLVTGAIAAAMSEHNLTAHEAWYHVAAHRCQAHTDGSVGKILLMETP